jgi:hypothetical protein
VSSQEDHPEEDYAIVHCSTWICKPEVQQLRAYSGASSSLSLHTGGTKEPNNMSSKSYALSLGDLRFCCLFEPSEVLLFEAMGWPFQDESRFNRSHDYNLSPKITVLFTQISLIQPERKKVTS